MRQLKPQDAQFLHLETDNNLSNATMLCLYTPPEGNSKFDATTALRNQLSQRLHLSTMFTHRIETIAFNIDYPYWVADDHFHLNHHLHHCHLSQPGDRKALYELSAEFHSRPLDLRRPPWEALVVTGLDAVDGMPEGSFALLVKIHHAAIDGTSAMRLFLALHDDCPPGLIADGDNDTSQTHRRPGYRTMLGNASRHAISAPFDAAGSVLKQWRTLRKRSDQGAPVTEKNPVPSTRFNQPVGPDKILATLKLDLAKVKPLRQLVEGATLNDVILAVCGGALHHYLEHHQQLPNIPLVAWVPINTRPEGDTGDGNNITATAIQIASQIADPIERLASIVATTQDAKAARSGISARVVTDLSQHLTNVGMALFTRLLLATNATGKLCNLAVSNVPGPQTPLSLGGAQCREQYGLVPLADRMGLFVVVLSYNGLLTLSITSTEDILPDADFFVGCLQAEFDALCQRHRGA